MPILTELIDAYPVNDTVLSVQRDEDLLLSNPPPGAMKMWRDYAPLTAFNFPMVYFDSAFAPPLDVYASDHVRVEWQKMAGRQPFYHRNADVDEISYHVSGERTLVTERGSVGLQTGDFARIPVGVAHDNRGVEDVHLIFYIPAPVTECVEPSRTTSYKMPPFEGWQANRRATEMMTECLGARGCDIAVSLTDEQMLLDAAKAKDNTPIAVLRGESQSNETDWLYRSESVWLGSTTLRGSRREVYRKHRRADEIQCQVKGRRTLVTQRGCLELEAGDWVCIPLGTAFTDFARDGSSTHVSVLTRWPAEAKKEGTKTANETSPALVKQLREGVQPTNGQY